MKVNIATNAGFCAGVKIAVRKALAAAKDRPGKVYMLGDIVHNEIVVKDLAAAGVKTVSSITKIPKGATILIRAHGAKPDIYKKARRRGLKIIDATCPMVADIHQAARDLQKRGFRVGVIGDKGHDEVVGIAGQAKDAVILESAADCKKIKGVKKIGLVVQSTQASSRVREILGGLVGQVGEIMFLDTVCLPTKKRQKEMKVLPGKNDVMIIIGSPSSANTKRLVEISKKINPRTYRVMTSADVKKGWFRKAKTVGVTAGASTPDSVINEVVKKLKELP